MYDATKPERAIRALLIVTLVLVAAVTFVLSFVGLRDYAIRVAQLPWQLAPLVPVGVDGLTVCAVAATYLLRDAHWRVRFYAWFVFAVAIAASVAGNVLHARADHLTLGGVVGAAAAPVLLALASHLVIVTHRALGRGTRAKPATRAVDSKSGKGKLWLPDDAEETTATQTTGAATSGRPKRTNRRVAPKASANGDLRDKARRLVEDGADLDAVAATVRRSRRTVERWTTDMRRSNGSEQADG